MSLKSRPTEAVFADGKNARPLALHPDAINVSYPTREVRDRKTYELRAMVASDVAEIADSVAVLSIDGPLEHKGGDSCWYYWQTYEDLARDFKLLCDDASVRAIVLKFDSPGGDVSGLNETVAIMQGMKDKSGKPVVAYVDESCYSAAYALAMVADEIFMPASAGVGSIGVITAMCDVTKMNEKDGIRVEVIASGTKKTDGHPQVALTDGAIKRTRTMVDKLAASFFDLVSAGRGIDAKTIEAMQAGVYTGQDAVDAGLADGIMSLSECLTVATNAVSQPKTPTDRSSEKESPPMATGLIGATKALNDAHKAMAAAKTDADRALAAARILAAEDLAAKVKKTKTVTTDTHEEETDDGEPDDDDEDAEKAEFPSKDDDDEDAEKASASAVLPGKRDVIALARKITGKKSIDEVMGALQGMADSHRKTSKLAAEVAQLKADAEATKVSALVSQGIKAGKLAPSQRAWAKTQSPASLKAYLDAAPKMVHTADEEHTEARIEGGAMVGSVTAEMAKIWRKQGFTEADFPKLVEKLNSANKRVNGAS